MKKIKLYSVCFILALVSFSCSSDDDSNVASNSNVLKIGNTELALRFGVIENYGSFNNLTNFDVTLIDSNVTIVDGEPVPENNIITGINFELYTDSNQDLVEGEYPLVDFSDDTPQTLSSVAILENVDVNSEDEIDDPPFFVQGSVQVISNGPEYEIEFSGVDNLGREISGVYKGTLTFIDSSE